MTSRQTATHTIKQNIYVYVCFYISRKAHEPLKHSHAKFASIVDLIFLISVSIFLTSYILSFLSYEYFKF